MFLFMNKRDSKKRRGVNTHSLLYIYVQGPKLEVDNEVLLKGILAYLPLALLWYVSLYGMDGDYCKNLVH